MKLTNQQILNLSDAIQALDGAQFTQVLEGKPVAVFKGYRLSHTARWNLARNQGKLQAVIADFNRAKSALILQHTNGESAISPAHPGFNQFADDFAALAAQQLELELAAITLPDLRMPENEQAGSEFPIAVLTALQPIIEC